MKEYDKLLERMRALKTEQLNEIVSISFEDYTDLALEAARAVLEERGVKRQLDGSGMSANQMDFKTFKQCIELVDYKGVELKLKTVFHEPDKNIAKYRDIYQKLKLMKPAKSKVKIFVAQIREDIRAGYPFEVFGVEPGTKEHFGLEMFPWNEWLAFEIHEKSKGFILNLGLEEFMAIALKKMTSLGFTEAEIERRIEEMQSFGDDLFGGDDGDKIMV